MKKLLLILLLCSPLFAANDFTGDPNLASYCAFEDGDFDGPTLRAVLGLDLGNPSGISRDATNYKVGASSAVLSSGLHRFTVTDADNAWPFQNAGSEVSGTFCIWIRPTTVNAYNFVVCKGYTGGSDLVINTVYRAAEGTEFTWGTGTGTTAEASGYVDPGTIVADQWYHMAWGFEGPTKNFIVRIYDASADAVFGATGTGSAAMNIEGGAWRIGERDDGYNMTGQVDDLQAFNRLLTADEIDDIRSGVYSVGGGNGAVLNHGFSF